MDTDCESGQVTFGSLLGSIPVVHHLLFQFFPRKPSTTRIPLAVYSIQRFL